MRGVSILLCLVLIAGVVYEQAARRRVAREFPPPGKLLDIGGRRIHLDCEGTGSPGVVLESGADTSGSVLWYPVQKGVAQFTRVCSYDRAGLMWSDTGPLPRDGTAIVNDLHKVLEVAGERGPYVMAGASLGGPLIMLYTKSFGAEVAGLVFVDAAHPAQTQRLEQATGKHESTPWWFSLLRPLVYSGWTGLPRLLLPAPILPELPQKVVDEITAYQPTSLGPSFDEADAMEDDFREAFTLRNLGDRPLAVLSHGKPWSAYSQAQHEASGLSQREFEAHEAEWARLQDEEATWSSDSTHRTLSGSSHVIQLEQPDAVVGAIREVVEKVRAKQDQSLHLRSEPQADPHG
jgi:pimeloyl-ACP methyl ester carboxylesterase